MSQDKIKKTEQEWQQQLTPEEFHICRQGGTERAFTGKYWQCDGKTGVYRCKCCNTPLFDAEHKFDSGSGWPSFYQSIDAKRVGSREDLQHGMQRTEILCQACDAHLGHVFEDGPAPTGLRYCVNSASLAFVSDNEESE